MDGMKPLVRRQQRLGDQLYGQILEQIVAGAFREGSKLPSESQICKAFQVSRPTVREALMRLHADGLVATRQGSGTFVQKRPSGQLTDLARISDVPGLLRCMEVRMVLEERAAGLAAERHTAQEMDNILQALEVLRSHSGTAIGAGSAQADYRFHQAVAGASGNELFAAMLETLNDTMMQAMAVAHGLTRSGSAGRGRRVVEEHDAIADAIQRRDPEGASLSMRYHLYRARQRVTDGGADL
jgi:DNA-binding FadR family transcriptional regulator